jgi:hypothetical protein
MRPFKRLRQRRKSRAFKLILTPIFERFKSNNELESRGYRPLQKPNRKKLMMFECV